MTSVLKKSSQRLRKVITSPASQTSNISQHDIKLSPISRARQAKLKKIIAANLEYFDGEAVKSFELEAIPEILQHYSWTAAALANDHPGDANLTIEIDGKIFYSDSPGVVAAIKKKLNDSDIAWSPSMLDNPDLMSQGLAQYQDALANNILSGYNDMEIVDQGFEPPNFSEDEIVQRVQGTPIASPVKKPKGKVKRIKSTPIQVSQYEKRYSPGKDGKRTTREPSLQRSTTPVSSVSSKRKRHRSSPVEFGFDNFDSPISNQSPNPRGLVTPVQVVRPAPVVPVMPVAPVVRDYPLDPGLAKSPLYSSAQMKTMNSMENRREYLGQKYHHDIRRQYIDSIANNPHFKPPDDWLKSKHLQWSIPSDEVLVWYMSPGGIPYQRNLRGNTSSAMPPQADRWIASKPFLGKHCMRQWNRFKKSQALKGIKYRDGPADHPIHHTITQRDAKRKAGLPAQSDKSITDHFRPERQYEDPLERVAQETLDIIDTMFLSGPQQEALVEIAAEALEDEVLRNITQEDQAIEDYYRSQLDIPDEFSQWPQAIAPNLEYGRPMVLTPATPATQPVEEVMEIPPENQMMLGFSPTQFTGPTQLVEVPTQIDDPMEIQRAKLQRLHDSIFSEVQARERKRVKSRPSHAEKRLPSKDYDIDHVLEGNAQPSKKLIVSPESDIIWSLPPSKAIRERGEPLLLTNGEEENQLVPYDPFVFKHPYQKLVTLRLNKANRELQTLKDELREALADRPTFHGKKDRNAYMRKVGKIETSIVKAQKVVRDITAELALAKRS